jgi:hypothetical protein
MLGRYATADQILRDVALEVGLAKNDTPFASTNPALQQLAGLLNAAGQELVLLHEWQTLVQRHQITTQAGDTGDYPLPADFSRMINQTGWEHTNRLALGGPLSAQVWTYLLGRDLVSQTIYASFRLVDGVFSIFPQPPPVGLNINFEYISRSWVADNSDLTIRYDELQEGNNRVLFEPILVKKFLKAKHLEAKGFDASSARLEFENMFIGRAGQDEGAPVLSASRMSGAFPYLTPYGNTSDTGYGLP